MRKLCLLVCLAMIPLLGDVCLAEEFLIGPYRAYALMGEAKLTPDTDYVSFTGDYGFSSWLPASEVIERHLAHEASLLSNFRLSVINLEAMLPRLSGDEADIRIGSFVIDTLKKAGYDVVARANNHALDQGVDGVSYNTIQLARAKLAMIGTRELPVYEWDTGGKKVAIFALTDSIDKEDQKRLILRIDKADLAFIKEKTSQAHFRIAFVHLGSMSHFLSPHERKQVARLLDAGTDLVVSTGSHFIKGFVAERGKPVAYGIGNHLFPFEGIDTEPIGMHLVAGFKSGALVQLFVVPFYNTIRRGNTGPLNEISFASFKKTFLERSTTDTDRYYSDPRSLKTVEESLSKFRFSKLQGVKGRHFVYAVGIIVHNYPIMAAAGCVVVLSFGGLAIRWTILTRRRHNAGKESS